MTRRRGAAHRLQQVPWSGVVVADQQRWGWSWEANGASWRSKQLTPTALCHGVGMLYPDQFCAVYAAGGTIWLQVGDRLWSVTGIESVVQQRDRLSSATYEVAFLSGRRESVRLKLPAAVVAHRLIAPTYDEIDSWSDDIMKTLPHVQADGWRASHETPNQWVRRVLPRWETGFRRSSP